MYSSLITKDMVAQSLAATLICAVGALGLFFMVEPTVTRSATANDTFEVTQEITDEISFHVPASDVTMAGAIAGITGGHATGTTSFVIRSNSTGGYTVDIAFSNSPAMRGEVSNNTALRNYGSSTEPSFGFNSSTSAQFGYTVSASTTTDLDPSFLDNGSACNTGAADAVASCWMAPITSNYRIINRGTSAENGATTTLMFRVTVPSNPTPGLVEDFYTATATLTATNQ